MRLRRRWKKHPRKLSVNYVKQVRERCGVLSHKQYFHLRDYSRKIQQQFGRLRGLWRVHYNLSEACQLGIDGEWDHMLAFCIQMLKALHQVSLDNGDWSSAELLIPSESPTGRPAFGGDEEELRGIFSYRKAMRELRMGLLGARKADAALPNVAAEEVAAPVATEEGATGAGEEGTGEEKPRGRGRGNRRKK